MDDLNIVLTGFPGTGKSTVGRRLAERLDRPFVDVDAEIEARAGVPVRAYYAEHGETAFRALEREACRAVARRTGVVVSTGGGALVDPTNRAALEETGRIVCLTCDIAEVLRRLGDDGERPLLGAVCGDRPRRVEALLDARAEAYAALPHHIDTTRRTHVEVVDALVELLGEIAVPLHHPRGAYDVRIGLGGLERLGDAMRSVGIERSAGIALVTNPIVHAHHGDATLASLRSAGYRPELMFVPDGEPHKRLVTVDSLYDRLADAGLDRRGVVVGLGGGVTTDLAGFAAATYLRGVRLVLVPTTLLAMVDAAVGGKTGVDLPHGKNLVGAFWHPELVVADPRVLRTLPEAEIRCGLAEVLKHGILGAPSLFEELSNGAGGLEEWWSDRAVERIARAVRVKVAVVEQDPDERGSRAMLNLGHTIGHAIEVTSGYAVRHGEAVAIGMVAAAHLAAKLGERPIVDAVEATLARWGLPIRCPEVGVDRLIEAMGQDKKRTAAGLRWILPRSIGDARIVDGVPEEAVRGVLAGMGARRD